MDQTKLAALRAALEAERERLAAEVDKIDTEERELLSEASGENAYRDHMADQGTATFEREMDLSFEESAREHLKEIEAALERIDSGTYSECERCSATIPVERLEAVPTARLCISCKEAEER